MVLEKEGTIVRIIERGTKQLVGTYTESKNFGFVIPDDKRIISDIFLFQRMWRWGGAVEGHKVVVKKSLLIRRIV
ncbi:hypothetical protein GCM10020331_027860 [Ectobacillus funiculus]